MKQTKNLKIIYGILAVITVSILVFPTGDTNYDLANILSFSEQSDYADEPTILNSIEANAAEAKTHNINMNAVNLPDGRKAYQMVSHTIDIRERTFDVTEQRYGLNPLPSVPGPVIIIDEGDEVFLTLENQLGSDCVSVHVHGVHYSIEDDGTLMDVNGVEDSCATTAQTKTYHWIAAPGTAGTWPYHDHTFGGVVGAEEEGLYGAIIVNKPNVTVLKDGIVTDIPTEDLDKEFVLYMHNTSFWGIEIDHKNGGLQTPLWLNPNLVAKENDDVRFHIIGLGNPFHTFHMHAHRWLEDGTLNKVVDTQNIGPLTREVFYVKAGEGVGTGEWMYHCHVLAHMEAGMTGIFSVVDTDAPSVPGPSPFDGKFVSFELTDEPGSWFKVTNGPELGALGYESLKISEPGSTVNFQMTDTNTVHTITSLIYPVSGEIAPDPPNMPFDQSSAFLGGATVTLEDPGLYVFTCKVHPYMFGAVIIDDPNTVGLDLGNHLRLVTGTTVPSSSDLSTRLLRTFLISTNSANWQDYESGTWSIVYPENIPLLTDIGVVDLKDVLEARYGNNISLDPFSNPVIPAVGEILVNTQFEYTDGKQKPGSVAIVDGNTWNIDRKFAFPSINMNHPHNMWTNADQNLIYQTQWFDNKLTSFDRVTGEIKDNKIVGEAPSHVMTNPVTDKIYVAMNGEDFVAELSVNPDGTFNHLDNIPMQTASDPSTNPHGHWISADGKYMVTPNSFTGDSTIYDFDTDTIQRVSTGAIPLAIGMMPDGSKYYVANLLDSSISVIETSTAFNIKNIDLLQNYDPISGAVTGPVGALPIQTPVSPDGKFVVTATLLPTITIVNTSTDTLVASLSCDAGCHGVQFGAKDGGGYYAYVSSKFSNDLIVVDPDPNGDDDGSDAEIVGRISLVTLGATNDFAGSTNIVGFNGYGGQGILPIPNVYNGWVQNLPVSWKDQLTCQQQDPINPDACMLRIDPEPLGIPPTVELPTNARTVQPQQDN